MQTKEVIIKDNLDKFERFLVAQLQRNIDRKRHSELTSGNPSMDKIQRALAKEKWADAVSNEYTLKMVLEVFQFQRKLMDI